MVSNRNTLAEKPTTDTQAKPEMLENPVRDTAHGGILFFDEADAIEDSGKPLSHTPDMSGIVGTNKRSGD